MIDIKEIFNDEDVVKTISLWVPDGSDGADLAGAAEFITDMKIPAVSVAPNEIKVVWPWLEKLNLKLMTRFNVANINEHTMSELAVDIKTAFKNGADAAQIIVKLSDLERFVDSFVSVRADLFFNKDLCIGLDIFDVWPLDWERVFESLKKIQASALLLILSHEDKEKSDFTGRIYAALSAWNANPDMELHVLLNESYTRAEQVYRLACAGCPDLKLKCFVSY